MALTYNPAHGILDFSGINNALGRYTQGVNQNARQEQWNALSANMPGIDPAMAPFVRQAGPDQGPGYAVNLFQAQQQRAAQQAQQDRAHQTQLAQMAEQRRMHDSRLALDRQTLEKNSAMQPYQIQGIQADIEAKKRKAQLDEETMRLLSGGGAQGQQAAPPMQPPMPGADPNIRPQSDNIGQQPMPGVVLAQAGQPQGQPQPAQAPQQGGSAFDNMTSEQLINMAGVYAARGIKPMADYLTKRAEAKGFGKEANNDLDKKIINTIDLSARLDDIKRNFDKNPMLLTYGAKAEAAITTLLDGIRLGNIKPSDAQIEQLKDSTRLQQSSFNNLNQYIKEMSGAAVTWQEAQRIERTMPTAGTGFFDGDTPTVFKTKLEAVMDQAKLALARYHYLRKRGFDMGQFKRKDFSAPISLDQMDKMMESRAREIANEIRRQNPRMDDRMIRIQADRATGQEFGV